MSATTIKAGGSLDMSASNYGVALEHAHRVGDPAHERLNIYRRELRVAALEYTCAILSEIRLLDGGEFQRVLNTLLGTIIMSAKDPKVTLP